MSAEPLQLMTRRGCHLCELVREPVAHGADELGLALLEYDVDEQDELRRLYGSRVPVLLSGGVVLGEGRFDPEAALEALRPASPQLTDR